MLNLSDYTSIVVLTGAGISAESGLKTFRDSGGLWEGHRVEDVATPEAFQRNPQLVHQFYNQRRDQLVSEAHPNAAHKALAKFESAFQGKFLLVTQNVDNLHEQAGSRNVLHMHGELMKLRCIHTDQIFDVATTIQTHNPIPIHSSLTTPCPCCNQAGALRPHIVWFGEMPLFMEEIESALSTCDLFVSIGTSGNVYPAAGFVAQANHYGAETLELNLEPSATQNQFKHADYGPATTLVSDFFTPVT